MSWTPFFAFFLEQPIVFEVFKVLLIIICKMQLLDLLFLVAVCQILHQQISFFTNFQSFIQHLKKRFSSRIFLFNGFTQTASPPPPPLPLFNGQNPLRGCSLKGTFVIYRYLMLESKLQLLLDVSILTLQCCCWLCFVHKSGGFLGGNPHEFLKLEFLATPLSNFQWGINEAISQLVQLSLNCCR